ncbi:MAG: aconitate hydratase [Deltaproteobacteria bacterium]|nr:aconitate hydratase [Deltaproteobacteria bacterium]
MEKTLAAKILDSHIVVGDLQDEIGIKIDQTLTQDATGTMAYLQFEAMGLPGVQTQLSVSYIDHNTTQIGFENADDHRYLQGVARKYGIYLSRAGNGICHQVHLERFGVPGMTLIGSDSHTPTAGAIGMLAIGAGGLDVALALAGKPFFLRYPLVLKVNLIGRFSRWVSAKDVILKVLDTITTKGNSGYVLEYGGDGVKTLSVPERATIANMGAETGALTSLFPCDEETRFFLRSQGRESAWRELVADSGAVYDKEITIDLSLLEPMVAKPHSPDNTATIKSIAGLMVNQVCIGSCTNSSYKDLAMVAKIMEGRSVHPNVDFIIAPGSRQVLLNIENDGYLALLLRSGARIMENACGFCIGNGCSPPSRGVSLRTSNRNFLGRSGTKDAEVFLVSPETAAVAALCGCVCDPREAGIVYPAIEVPSRFIVDDSMVIPPLADPSTVIVRGPNIGEPPHNDPLPADIVGVVTLKVGDKITTDHIMPAGDKMKYRSNIIKYAEFVFQGVDPTFFQRAYKNKQENEHNIVIAGLSYGQGSSREHAAICPMFLGVKAVIAKSFERIHAANLINFGIIPFTFADHADYERIEQGDSLRIACIRVAMATGDENFILKNETRGTQIMLQGFFSQRQRNAIIAGGIANVL